ncbi:hypothetical protein BPAE_0001g00570 [Botrytis paeoniae]|uniref:Uncharacterized protein n=1 Tax=Botrytis paeoniae TaxID=278948 RepID=A0A4Z1GAD2_9HELO|nr:hypothetical protein BPAE_0001g00570 [Botrytis paeoniae]
MGLFQRAEEIVFKWRKVVNESRPRCLQDIHLDRTPSNLSITRSVYKERRRVAKEDARRKKRAAKRVKQEGKTHFKEMCKKIDDLFDGTITYKEYLDLEDEEFHAAHEELVQQISDNVKRVKAKVDRAKEGVSKGCDKAAEITQRTAEKAVEKVQRVAEEMERRKQKRERRRIAKEEKEAKYLMDIEFWNREIEKGRLNEDHGMRRNGTRRSGIVASNMSSMLKIHSKPSWREITIGV